VGVRYYAFKSYPQEYETEGYDSINREKTMKFYIDILKMLLRDMTRNQNGHSAKFQQAMNHIVQAEALLEDEDFELNQEKAEEDRVA
jgi:hypothetical protein